MSPKSIYLFILVVLSSVFFPACSTDFEIAAPWQEISIVYGLLNASQETQYIKVNKAFLSETTNALDIAAVSDSIYHTDAELLTVVLEEYDASQNLLKTITLERVDAATESIDKEVGIFSDSPYYLYKTDVALNPERTYHLEINTPSGEMVTSESPVIGNFSVSRPRESGSINDRILRLSFETYKMRWKRIDNISIYDVDMLAQIRERKLVNGQEVVEDRTLTWNMLSNYGAAQNTQNNNNVEYEFDTELFYNFLATQLDVNEDILDREMLYLDFEFHAASEPFKLFNDVALAQVGITSSQVQPSYTNIDNGLGLFATRYTKRVNEVPLSAETINTIACGEITGHLKFKSDPSNEAYPGCQ